MGVSSPAHAGGDSPINSVGFSAVAPNQAVNNLSPSVTQTSNGGVGGIFHNQNYSASGGNIIGVGTGYICRGGELKLFGGGTTADSGGFYSNGLSVGVALSIPWKNAADRACEGVAQLHLQQKRYDTALTLVRECAKFAQLGVRVDYTHPEFVHLQPCEAITLVTQQVTVVQPRPLPVKPIPGPQ